MKMNTKKISKSVQGRDSREREINSWFDYKKLASLGQIPKDLAWKVGGFVKRNALVVIHHLNKTKPEYRCCDSCLKAYMIKESQKYDKNLGIKIDKVLNCKVGHGGYFLDAGRLVKIG